MFFPSLHDNYRNSQRWNPGNCELWSSPQTGVSTLRRTDTEWHQDPEYFALEHSLTAEFTGGLYSPENLWMNLKKGLSIPWWDLTESEAGEQHWGHSLVSWGHRAPAQDTGHVVTDIHVRTSAGCGTRDTRVSVMSLAADCHVLITHCPLSSVWLVTPNVSSVQVMAGWWPLLDWQPTPAPVFPGPLSPGPASPASRQPGQPAAPGAPSEDQCEYDRQGPHSNYNNFISGLLIAGDRMSSLAPTPAAPDKTYWVWHCTHDKPLTPGTSVSLSQSRHNDTCVGWQGRPQLWPDCLAATHWRVEHVPTKQSRDDNVESFTDDDIEAYDDGYWLGNKGHGEASPGRAGFSVHRNTTDVKSTATGNNVRH